MKDKNYMSEKATRNRFIDVSLRSSGWTSIVDFEEDKKYDFAAVREYQTDNGPADYVLFHNGRALAAVEAKKISQIMKRFRQSVFAAAFRGELVPQDPRDEPVEKVLDKIKTKKRRKWEENLRLKGKDPKNLIYEEPEPVETDNLPELPKGWIWTTINNLSIFEKGSIRMGPFGSQLKKHELVSKGVRVLGIENVANNKFDFADGKYITSKKYEKLEGFTVYPGDVLVTMMGTIGRSCVVPSTIGKAIISSHLLKITPEKEICNPDFLSMLIWGGKDTINQIETQAKGIIMKGLNTKIIKSLIIPLPPVNEQKRILSKIEELFSFADQIEKSVEEAKKRADRLDQSILAKAFRGELVPQDPKDETAVDLLKTIKLEMEKTLEVKTRNKKRGDD